jgi:putative oxidoreductase
MKVATLIARILLGLIFFVFGLNPFLHFLPAIMPSGLAGQFLGLRLIQSQYVYFIGAV